ncbi:Barley B recombinant-like protein D [Acorus calamus]|uniref:GAGA-binding transcriptional activator n=1 Tax=Acorus calamus TaxID=4465 RepID=A0AAV9D7C9_ACOCL|nr:Barley B recombinant-like protein D [Acorus calamus]
MVSSLLQKWHVSWMKGYKVKMADKPDDYKAVHAQWMMPHHQMKDHQTLKLMAVMAERDAAIQERNLALAEKKTAQTERDMAILQRDNAIAERNKALLERDSALAALQYSREGALNMNDTANGTTTTHRGPTKYVAHHLQYEAPEAYPIPASPVNIMKPPPRRMRRSRKETKVQIPVASPSKKTRKGREDLNRHLVTVAKTHHEQGSPKHEWREQDLGLNQVTYDDTTMPIPVCSCTGAIQQCYKWGNGGWQSACCTTTLSMYPLPVLPNKRHARIGGRKMSGGAFNKLLSRLAAEGHDLSLPVDLKSHWARHGTNRYITIR